MTDEREGLAKARGAAERALRAETWADCLTEVHAVVGALPATPAQPKGEWVKHLRDALEAEYQWHADRWEGNLEAARQSSFEGDKAAERDDMEKVNAHAKRMNILAAVLRQAPPNTVEGPTREEIARVVKPAAWHPDYPNKPAGIRARIRAASLETADKIRALFNPLPAQPEDMGERG